MFGNEAENGGKGAADDKLYWIFAEQAGGDTHMLLKAMDKILLAVVAGGIGDFSYRLLGRCQQIFGLIDAAQHDIFIGRITSARFELS